MSTIQAGTLPATTTLDLVPVIQLGTNAIAIAELSEKYKNIAPVDTKSFEELKKAIAVFRELRGTVTKIHEEKKKPILEEGRALDAEKTKLLALIKDAETPLIAKKDTYEAEKEKIRQQKIAEEQARVKKIQDRIAAFGGYLVGIHNKNADTLKSDISFFDGCIVADSFDYMEYVAAADSMKHSTKKSLEEALAARLVFEEEQAKLAAEKLRLEEERAAMEKQRLEQEAEQKRLADAEAAKLKEQYDALEKAKAEQKAKDDARAQEIAAELRKLEEVKRSTTPPPVHTFQHSCAPPHTAVNIAATEEAKVVNPELTESELYTAIYDEMLDTLKMLIADEIIRESSVIGRKVNDLIKRASKA